MLQLTGYEKIPGKKYTPDQEYKLRIANALMKRYREDPDIEKRAEAGYRLVDMIPHLKKSVKPIYETKEEKQMANTNDKIDERILLGSNEKNEFFTTPETVQHTVGMFCMDFQDKIVYCPCDDVHSSFINFFLFNFRELGLKGLISSCYDCTHEDVTVFEWVRDESTTSRVGYKKVKNSVAHDFGDCTAKSNQWILDKADVYVTNPPFNENLSGDVERIYPLTGRKKAMEDRVHSMLIRYAVENGKQYLLMWGKQKPSGFLQDYISSGDMRFVSNGHYGETFTTNDGEEESAVAVWVTNMKGMESSYKGAPGYGKQDTGSYRDKIVNWKLDGECYRIRSGYVNPVGINVGDYIVVDLPTLVCGDWSEYRQVMCINQSDNVKVLDRVVIHHPSGDSLSGHPLIAGDSATDYGFINGVKVVQKGQFDFLLQKIK